jgi:RND family efflux transporter MFP subunit
MVMYAAAIFIGCIGLVVGARACRRTPVVTSVAAHQSYRLTDEKEPLLSDLVVGTIIANESMTMVAEVEGRVKTVRADLGDPVKKGEVLLTIDSTTIASDLAAARASLQLTEAELEKAGVEVARAAETRKRYQSASAQDVVTGDELRDAIHAEKLAIIAKRSAEASLAEKRVQIEKLENQLAKTTIRAPFAGTVSLRMVDPGTRVTVGGNLMTVVSSAQPWIRFAIPETQVAAFKVGAPVEILSEKLEQRVPAVVERIAPDIDVYSGLVIAEARFRDPVRSEVLRPGGVVYVSASE